MGMASAVFYLVCVAANGAVRFSVCSSIWGYTLFYFNRKKVHTMKKALSLLLALVMCLSLCACAVQSPENNTPVNKPKTVDEACAEADKLVAQWNSEAFAGCGYSGEYDTELAGGPYYKVNARYFKSIIESSDYPEYVLTGITQDIFSDVYPKLCDIFEGLNVCVLITLADENGENSYSGIIDGEITYFD